MVSPRHHLLAAQMSKQVTVTVTVIVIATVIATVNKFKKFDKTAST